MRQVPILFFCLVTGNTAVGAGGPKKPISSCSSDFRQIGAGEFDEIFNLHLKFLTQDSEIAAQHARNVEILNEMGARFKATNLDRLNSSTFREAIIEIVDLPKPTRFGTGYTRALLHPDISMYREKLESYGYKLVVDSGLEKDVFKPGVAYADKVSKILALKADAPWHVFIHEFEHVSLHQFLDARVFSIEKGHTLPPEVIAILGKQKAQAVASLESQGMPTAAIHEILAVSAQLQSLGYRRFIPGTRAAKDRLFLRQYDFQKRIDELSKLEHRTESQERLLAKAHELQSRLTARQSSATRLLGSATVVASGVAYDFEEIIYSEESGEAYGRQDNGEWIKLTSVKSK